MKTSLTFALYTILKKETHRIIRLWMQTLLPPLINMSLYFFIFGEMIGRHIEGFAGVSYAQFITPGLVVLSMVTNAYMNASSSVFLDKFQGCLQEILVSSVPEWALVLGVTLGGLVRGLLVGLLVALAGYLCVGASVACWWVWFIVAISSCCLFAILGGLNALYANHFDGINFIPSFILTPLTFIGGVFYPTNQLPYFWQHLSLYNPLVYVVKAMRQAYLHGEIPIHLIFWLWFFIILSAILCVLKIKKRSGVTIR